MVWFQMYRRLNLFPSLCPKRSFFGRLCAGFWWLPRYVGRCRPDKPKLSRKFFAVKQRLHIRIVNDMRLRVVVYQLLSLITKVTQVNTLPEAHISRSGFLFLCTFPRKCGGVSWFSAMLNCDAAVNIYEINLQSPHLFYWHDGLDKLSGAKP